jgi:hypothetical protein
MKRNLILIGIFIIVVLVGILLYFVFAPEVQSLPGLENELQKVPIASGEITENDSNFEKSFYQDLSDLFKGETNGYEEIQGEYGFVQ